MITVRSEEVSLIAGGAGFIAQTVISRLLEEGRVVLAIDNLTRGKEAYLAKYVGNNRFHFMQSDLADREHCTRIFSKARQLGHVDEVWHLAANSDIPAGVENHEVDLKDTFMTTVEILHGMKKNGVNKIYFASSSAIYGDMGDKELREQVGPTLPISNYGAMKLASEGLISAAREIFLERASIFRFPNVVGVPATHGVVYDFISKLSMNKESLQVLGDGTQQKAYLHVTDLVSAMLKVRAEPSRERVDVINVGPVDSGVTVKWIAEQVIKRVSPGANIIYGEGNRGWVGDVPRFKYSTEKLQEFGWTPRLGSSDALILAIDEIATEMGA